ncbi:hypothetical protein [Hyphomicrobium sp.]|uniref:hypothetical protein n=1 Tax=Hyphomicrobium sp. TaxID=82 RepID=UPI002FDF806E
MTVSQASFAMLAAVGMGGFSGYFLVQGFRTGTIRILHWRDFHAVRDHQPILFWYLAFYNAAMGAWSIWLALFVLRHFSNLIGR